MFRTYCKIQCFQHNSPLKRKLPRMHSLSWQKGHLGNNQAKNYCDLVWKLLKTFKSMSCRLELENHSLCSQLDFFPNLGDIRRDTYANSTQAWLETVVGFSSDKLQPFITQRVYIIPIFIQVYWYIVTALDVVLSVSFFITSLQCDILVILCCGNNAETDDDKWCKSAAEVDNSKNYKTKYLKKLHVIGKFWLQIWNQEVVSYIGQVTLYKKQTKSNFGDQCNYRLIQFGFTLPLATLRLPGLSPNFFSIISYWLSILPLVQILMYTILLLSFPIDPRHSDNWIQILAF